MNYGFVKVAAAVPRVKVADCKFNSERLEGLITIAEGKGVQILTFPEMCITGYTCGDLFAQQLLLEQAEMALIQILNSTRQLDIISILGMPVVVNSTVINAAVVIQKGKILGVVPKTYLPNYKEFYEQRWFTSALQVSENSVRLCGQIVPMGNNLLFETVDKLCRNSDSLFTRTISLVGSKSCVDPTLCTDTFHINFIDNQLFLQAETFTSCQ